MFQLLYPTRKSLQYLLDKRLSGPLNQRGHDKKKIPISARIRKFRGHHQHCQSISMTGNLRTIVTLNRVCATIVAVAKQ